MVTAGHHASPTLSRPTGKGGRLPHRRYEYAALTGNLPHGRDRPRDWDQLPEVQGRFRFGQNIDAATEDGSDKVRATSSADYARDLLRRVAGVNGNTNRSAIGQCSAVDDRSSDGGLPSHTSRKGSRPSTGGPVLRRYAAGDRRALHSLTDSARALSGWTPPNGIPGRLREGGKTASEENRHESEGHPLFGSGQSPHRQHGAQSRGFTFQELN